MHPYFPLDGSDSAPASVSTTLKILGWVPGRENWGLEPCVYILCTPPFFPHCPSTAPYPYRLITRVACSYSWDLGDLKPEWSEYVELERPWFYKRPRQRYQWDDPGSLHDHPPHLWTDVFNDLIFVGAAFQLGRLVMGSFAACSVEAADAEGNACIGMWSGVLSTTLYFQALFSLWALSKWFRSTLITDSPLHAAADDDDTPTSGLRG